MDEYDPATRRMSWTVGGNQGGEGADDAAEWFVEGVLEELDAPNEWFFSADESKLYYFHNASAGTPPPASLAFEAVRLKGLVALRGTPAAPVKDVTLRGLSFVDAAPTILDPHGLPSDGGGDWAIARNAAVFLEGTERATVDACSFERLDGNGVMISGFARNATVRGSEFAWLGENAIVSWGKTRDFPGHPKRPAPIPAGQGPDATGGTHPIGNVIDTNFIHEIGIIQKQVSCYFQAQTEGSTLSNNICFNGPRAGINFNARRTVYSADDFCRLDALLFIAMAWIFIPAHCFAIP